MLHVNPALEEKGLLVVFNPLDKPVSQTLQINLYYTGLTETARVLDPTGQERSLQLQRDHTIELSVEVPAQGMTWYVIR
jgi:hypothetical protein